MAKLQDVVAEVNGKRKFIQIMTVLYLVFLVVAAVAVVFSANAGVIIAICAVLFYLFYIRGLNKKYRRDFVEKSLEMGACRHFSSFTYDQNKELEKEIRSSGLFRLPDGASIRLYHGVQGHIRKMDIRFNEHVVQYDRAEKVRNVNDVRTLAGTVLQAPLCREMQKLGPVFVYDRSILTDGLLARIKAAGCVEMNDHADLFDINRLAIYLPDGTEWDEKSREFFFRRLKTLNDTLEKPYAFALENGNLLIHQSGRFYAEMPSVKFEVQDKSLYTNRFPELETVISFAE